MNSLQKYSIVKKKKKSLTNLQTNLYSEIGKCREITLKVFLNDFYQIRQLVDLLSGTYIANIQKSEN